MKILQPNPGISHKRRERWFYTAKSIAVVITFFTAFAPFAWALNTSAQSQRTTPKPIQDHKRPPSRHMPPPDKNERQSPGPIRELGAAVSHRTIDGYNGICSNEYPMYSEGQWQYAIFSICTYVVSRQTLHLTVVVREAQYNWGSAWYYNKYPMNIVGLEVQLYLPGGQRTILWTPPNSDPGSGKEFNFNYKVGLDCSGTYTVKINKGSLEGMYWKGTEWAVPLSPSMQTTQPNGPAGQDSLDKIWSEMSKNPAVPLAYQFGEEFEIPTKIGGKLCSLQQPGTLLVVQKASSLPNSGTGRLKPYLLGDTHTGPAKRCEMNSNAVTADGTKEIAEIFTPVGAWGRLGEPDFAINANYFDVRDQNGTTWLQTQCSVPLGVYYDNDPAGPTGGTHNAAPNKYLAGPGYFVDKAGTQAPEDTLFWIHSITNGPMKKNTFTITLSRTADADAASRQAKILEDGGYIFVAFSGTALIPTHFPGAAPDSGSVPTTRIGIGYDEVKDILYIFEGGSYQKGVDRADLAGIFEALGATTALEVDGGGSASLVIKDGSAVWGGQAKQVTSCPNSGAWCSPVTQPDGKSRPVPSWLGMNFSN